MIERESGLTMPDVSAKQNEQNTDTSRSAGVSAAWSIPVHSSYKAIKRMTHALFVLVFISVSLVLIVTATQHRQQWQTMPYVTASDSTLDQYAVLLAPSLAKSDIAQLEHIRGALISSPNLVGLELYTTEGERVFGYESPNYRDLVDEQFLLTRIKPIVHDEQQIGYLSVIFDIQTSFAFAQSSVDRNRKTMALVLLLGGIISAYCVRIFYKLRR